ncbi:TolC family protein [Fulvivirga sp. M361]|uniref:TolC family protein n=1 Tax=Fulvivirga sp. M361 TaxID=2594266 RepID=UPI00117A9AF4|nr:TolC family protein [Fulvivirga sp. M361]TRX59577.1 TolC family protein [Fulvivirga sp. M361]
MLKFGILILCCSSFTPLFGQNQLSLSDAIALSLNNNYDILIEKRNVELAKNNNNWGEAGLFPSLTAQLTGSQTIFDNREALSPFSIIGKTKTTQVVPSLALNWSLLNIHNIKISKQRLETLQRESAGNASIVISNTIQSVILGYYIALLEEQRLDEFARQLKLSRDRYELIKTRTELGSSITSDLLLEEENYLSDSTNYINQQLAYQNSVSNLNFLLGNEDAQQVYNLTDELIADFDLIDFESLLGKMETSNVDLRTQYLTQSVLGYDLALRRGERYPQLTLAANYDFTRNEQDISDWPSDVRNGNQLPEQGNNENITYGANFTISFTLFNGGRINRAIQNAIISEDIGAVRVERLKSSLARDLKQAVDQYNFRQQLYAINNRRYESSLKSLMISEEKFKNGSINSFDNRAVQNTNVSAAIARLQAIYNLIDSQVTILRLTGGIIETYVND